MKSLAIIGAGGWGTALAITQARAKRPVRLWVYESDLADGMARSRENTVYLPGVQIPEAVKADRNRRLLEVVQSVTASRAAHLAGRVVEVLVDGVSRRNAGELSGRTRCNRVVNFDGLGRVRVGDVVHARVTEVLPHSLRAALQPAPEEAVCSSR